MSLLAKQLESLRIQKGISEKTSGKRQPPPSILFTPSEAKRHDAEAFAALGLRGVAASALLEPELGMYSKLFEGAPPERDMLTQEENRRLNGDLRRMLLLLSPHLLTRGAQECFEGLLFRFHIHEYNVDDIMACALPYHDSPLFTRLIRGLHIEGNPRWLWLKQFKAGPLTLVRAHIAKYCTKDVTLLDYVGSTLQEIVRMQKNNRSLAVFFAALWLDTLALLSELRDSFVDVALPTLLLALRRPHLRDSFHASVVVAGALSVKGDLSVHVRAQLVERVAKQVALGGGEGRAAMGFLALHAQQQDLEDVLSQKVLASLAEAGPDGVAAVLPLGVDCSNLLRALARASLLCEADAEDSLHELAKDFGGGLISNALILQRYAEPVATGVLSAALTLCQATSFQTKPLCEFLRQSLGHLGNNHPLELGGAFVQIVRAALQAGVDTEKLVNLMTPVCPSVAASDSKGVDSTGGFLPVVLAFSHKSSKVRREAVARAVTELNGSDASIEGATRRQLMSSMVLRACGDQSPLVAAESLQAECLWASLPEASPNFTVPCLQSLLERLLGSSSNSSGRVETAFTRMLLENAQASLLVPKAMQCCAWICRREDCSDEHRSRVDSFMLPLFVFVAVGLDSTKDEEAVTFAQILSNIRSALLAFGAASQHPLLRRFKGGDSTIQKKKKQSSAAKPMLSGALVASLCDAIDSPQIVDVLFRIVEGRALNDHATTTSSGLASLGGRATQVAGARLLAESLPRLVATTNAESVFAGASFAFETLSLLLGASEVEESEKSNALDHSDAWNGVSQLSCSIFSFAASLPGDVPTPVNRRRTKRLVDADDAPGSAPDASLLASYTRTLRVVLERPKAMQAGLRVALKDKRCDRLFQPALCQLALLPTVPGRPLSGQANALHLLQGLVVSGYGGEKKCAWACDLCFVVPLVATLAWTNAKQEVRVSALNVLESMQDFVGGLDANGSSSASWGSTHAGKVLQEAGVLQRPLDVFSEDSWTIAETRDCLAGLPPKTLSRFLGQLLQHRGDIVKEASAVGWVLSKFIRGKGDDVKRVDKTQCASWAAALAMLVPSASETDAGLLDALPVAAVLEGLIEPLATSAESVIKSINDSTLASTRSPAALHLAALMVLRTLEAKQGELLDGTADAICKFLRRVGIPFVDAFAERCASGGVVVSDDMLRLTRALCQCLACVASCGDESPVASPIAKDLGGEAASSLLKIAVSCSSHSASEDVAGEHLTRELTGSQHPPSHVTATVRSCFENANLNAASLNHLLDSPDLKRKSTFPRRLAVLQLLYSHIAALKGDDLRGAEVLLPRLAELAMQSASDKLDTGGELLTSCLYSVAALSEHMFREAAALPSVLDVPTVCDRVQASAQACAGKFSGGILGAIIRACSALVSLLPALSPPKKALTAAVLTKASASASTSPLRCCQEALAAFSGPLGSDALALLRSCFSNLRRFPSAEWSAEAAAWNDVVVQARIRPLLQMTLLGNRTLLSSPGPDAFLSLARSAGLHACLDFAVLLYLARVATEVDDAKASGRKSKFKRVEKKKRRAADEEALDVLEEAGLVLRQNDGPEEAVETALRMLTEVTTDCRYCSMGTLVQSLCGLASELRYGIGSAETFTKGLGPLWGPALLPQGFATDLGAKHSLQVLRSGLTVVLRFVSEHGIPNDLDDEQVDTSSYRDTAGPDGITSGHEMRIDVARASAVAVCYAARGALFAEVLVKQLNSEAGQLAADQLDPCRACAEQLRRILWRSLAVNHPVTFFRSVCFSLGLPAFCPPRSLMGGRIAVDAELCEAESLAALVGASEALQESRELRAELGEDQDMDEEVQNLCAPLCSALMRYVCMELLPPSRNGGALQIASWQFLTAVCRFSSSHSPKTVVEVVLPAAAISIREMADNPGGKGEVSAAMQAAIASCVCMQTAVEQMGRTILECLNVIADSLLHVGSAFVSSAPKSSSDGLVAFQQGVLRTLQALIKSVGSFMSPFLERIVRLVAVPSPKWRTALFEAIGMELVASVPHRLLLPAVQRAAQAISEPGVDRAPEVQLLELQRLSMFQICIFSSSSPEFVASGIDAALAGLLQLVAGSTMAFRTFLKMGGRPQEIADKLSSRPEEVIVDASNELKWSKHCSKGAISQLHCLSAAAFTQFALRLSFEELKPRFAKILEWARHQQPHTLSKQSTRKASAVVDEEEVCVDAEEACRSLALVALMRGLVADAPDISEELLLPLALKDVTACLIAAKRLAVQTARANEGAKKRRRVGLGVSRARNSNYLQSNTWWWFDISLAVLSFVKEAFQQAGAGASQSKVVEDAVDSLIEPCIDIVDLFEFLPAADEAAVARELLQGVGDALVTLSAASDSNCIKRLLTGVLGKTKSEDAEVRLCAVKVCHRIWLDLGVQAVSGLSEVVMVAAELLEDEDSRVETSVRQMVKTIEDCTGESLQESLKH